MLMFFDFFLDIGPIPSENPLYPFEGGNHNNITVSVKKLMCQADKTFSRTLLLIEI